MANNFWKNLLVSIGSKLAKKAVREILKEELPAKEKIHPWRLCSVGRHWVKIHPMNVPVSEKNPDGKTTRHGHCADNPPKRKKELMRDYLSKNEIEEMAAEHFNSLTGPPTAGILLKKFPESDKYDTLIRGWVKYWNDIFKPKELLDPNLVKALMASESSFRVEPPAQNAGAAGKANGILQITDKMIKELGNPKGGIKDHYIEIDQSSVLDPNVSICAAVRCLFDKQAYASKKLKREASWMEAIMLYKGYKKEMIANSKKKIKDEDPKGIRIIKDFYSQFGGKYE
ncbi:MAG: transglycosylase SLT domain-containing protein [Pseudomonadota bacterium]